MYEADIHQRPLRHPHPRKKKLAKDKQGVRLCIVAMHYDRNAYNDYSDYYWFEYKDGEFYRGMK